ncbi:substrate-binding domain-containing protein [Aeromonas allosaccharophila]|uniref:sugar ABC transporter substrate-binding protein n=1 Tax=Aeromonas TaxID=642 RepID=UPI0015DC83E9|nr:MULTISPECIES: substrate-binding domain-containing protein [Aeromonas]WDO02732.1 substrate-binding domain-containing protein [Aeromonas allosaccharophila]BBT79145.1 sugar ABC transporter substrate-binding protein [Aeromonas veronii]BBU06224.1 sugar ABC transporter substrate-binding protein [Aeromonas veronii]
MHNTHTGNTHTVKRWLTGLLMSSCLLASQVGAAPSGKDMTIWFDLGGPVGESYVTVVQNGAKQAAEDLGVDLRLVYSDWQPQKMIENFKQAVAAKPTGIVVMGHPGDSAYQPLIADAITKGIKVTSVDTELSGTMANELSNGFGYVGDNNATRGINLAKEALRRSGLKKGDRAMVWGIKDIAQRSDSTRGLIKTLEEAGMKVDFIQISQEVDKDPSLGAPVVTSYLATHPDVKMVLVDHGALTAQMGNFLRNAAVKPGELFVAGFSLSPATADGIQSGYVQLVADCQPYLMGYLSVVQLVLSERYGFAGLDINTGAGFVTKDNIALIAPLAAKGLR